MSAWLCPWCGYLNTDEGMRDNDGLPYCCGTAEKRWRDEGR